MKPQSVVIKIESCSAILPSGPVFSTFSHYCYSRLLLFVPRDSKG